MTSELRFTGGVTTAALTVRTSPRAKVMRLRVDPRTGAVLLTIPKRMSQKKALEWASGQRAWIEAALADVEPAAELAPGAIIIFRGEPHLVDWHPDRARRVRVEIGRLLTGGPLEGLEPRLMRWLKAEAKRMLEAETREYAAKANVSVARVGVGDTRSRWGSCSSSGSIRYSWRLILAPDWVRRATVAHEVAHRVHMNHGPDFHALVHSLYGEDPTPARQWLRREGATLHRVGRSV